MSSGKDMEFRRVDGRQRARSYVALDRFNLREQPGAKPAAKPQPIDTLSQPTPKTPPPTLEQKPKKEPPSQLKARPEVKRSPPKPVSQTTVARHQPSTVLKRKSVGRRMQEYVGSTFVLRSRKGVILTSLGLLLLGIGIFFAVSGLRTNTLVQKDSVLQNQTPAGPSEDAISDEAKQTYSVPNDEPKSVKINSVNVDALIQKRAVKPNGQPTDPDNIYKVGWAQNSSKPSEDGAVLLNGFVQGPTQSGVFAGLSAIQVNDIITLEKGDGVTLTYKVVAIDQQKPNNINMQAALHSKVPGKKGLNILTTSERYDIKTNDFEKRLLVYAVLQ